MSTLVRARIRTAGAALALSLSASACGGLDGGADSQLRASLAPGQPAGTVTVAANGDPAQLVKGVQDAITGGGGKVAAVVDHAAAAAGVGVQIPPNTVVIGGPEAASLSLVQFDQRAGVNLPPPYQVRQDTSGATVLTYDSPEYLAAVSQVSVASASVPLADANAAVVGKVVPSGAAAQPAPLIGVTPVDWMLTIFGSVPVANTVTFLQRGGSRGGNTFIGSVDFVAEQPGARAKPGAAPAAPAVPAAPGALPAGPTRPTSVVLISRPAAEAPLLAVAPTIGLDLPMRFVVWIDDQNRTVIGYPDVRRIAVRHGISADDPNVVALAAEADKLGRIGAGIDK